MRGGHNVQLTGGAYSTSLWIRNFTGDVSVEGALIRMPKDSTPHETGDGISLNPDSSTLGTSRLRVINCRVEDVDGLPDGTHGDVFQLSSAYDPPNGYSSCPRTVTIERLTGTTAYQGLFLSNQHFDDSGYAVSTKRVELRDVNMRRTRADNVSTLIFLIDGSQIRRGDRPYTKNFDNVYVEPFADDSLDSLLFPGPAAPYLPGLRARVGPDVSADRTYLTYPPSMKLSGGVHVGHPPGGDFARRADQAGRGGDDVPGIGYRSPGFVT